MACQKADTEDENFNTLTKDWFVEDVSGDYLNLRFSVLDFSKYNIEKPEVTLGSADPFAGLSETLDWYNERIKTLNDYDTSKLSAHQLITYKTLLDYYQQQKAYYEFGKDYRFLFTPMSGDNNNLITNLSELKMRDEQDVKDLIILASDASRYIDEAIEYTRQQAKKGIVQPDSVQQEVIDSCKTFVAKVSDNALITCFKEQIADLKLANQAAYIEEYSDIVINQIIPAYQRIINMYRNELSGKAKNSGAICDYADGKELYKMIFQTYTGTSEDPAEVAETLWKVVAELIEKESELGNEHPETYYAYYGIDYEATLKGIQQGTIDSSDPDQYIKLDNANNQFGMSDPATIIAAFREALKTDYPSSPDVSVTADYLDESIATDGIVAYYVNASVDGYLKDNVIKVNKKYSDDDPDSLCSTLAHEGFPGHCYQITYYLDKFQDDIIRNTVNYLGYTEGWAMMAEDQAYKYLTSDSNLAQMYQLEDEMGYYIQAALDIEVNYNGLSAKEIAEKLVENVYTYMDATDEAIIKMAESVYTTLVGDPGTYLSYGYGYYSMLKLRTTAQEALGKKFNLKNFYQAVLDTGATSFEILNEAVASQLGY